MKHLFWIYMLILIMLVSAHNNNLYRIFFKSVCCVFLYGLGLLVSVFIVYQRLKWTIFYLQTLTKFCLAALAIKKHITKWKNHIFVLNDGVVYTRFVQWHIACIFAIMPVILSLSDFPFFCIPQLADWLTDWLAVCRYVRLNLFDAYLSAGRCFHLAVSLFVLYV